MSKQGGHLTFLRSAHTFHLCVFYGSRKKQDNFPTQHQLNGFTI